VRENIKRNEVFIEHISTELMIADPMIKGLPVKLFKSHVEHMGLIDSFCIFLFLLVYRGKSQFTPRSCQRFLIRPPKFQILQSTPLKFQFCFCFCFFFFYNSGTSLVKATMTDEIVIT
jgi:hypothetical protein